MMLYHVHELDGFGFGGFEGERTNFVTWKLYVVILMNELFCCFFFHDGVLYIILVMHACVYEL
jgi:hypothetical protein